MLLIFEFEGDKSSHSNQLFGEKSPFKKKSSHGADVFLKMSEFPGLIKQHAIMVE
jgi:hypothetical protein